jgi:amidase
MKTLRSLAVVLLLASGATQSAEKFHVEEATIEQIQQAILARQITSEQLVRLYLARI